MDEQIPQPQANSSPVESIPTPNADASVPKLDSPHTRYLLAAVMIIVAIGLGSWIWHNQASKLFPTPAPISDNQDQEKETLAKAVNSATLNIWLADINKIEDFSDLSKITLENGEYEYNSNACGNSPCTFRLGKVEYYDIDKDGDLDVFVQSRHWTGGMKEDTAVQIFLNTNNTLDHLGGIYTGQQLGYNWLRFDNEKIEVNYNTQYNGAAGYSDPKTLVYKLENGKITEIVNFENK
ncbi:MAG: hypothetical protein AAB455_02235 [Patescibacteria group bacterium]